MKDTTESMNKSLGAPKIISIDEGEIRNHLGEMVRKSVEDTLNSLLDAEADALCNAARYERSPDRTDTRAGHYTRQLHTKAGEVTLKVPKLRKLTFETSIIERYRRREASVEEAMIEMYLAGVSVRRVEDVTEALWGSRVSPSTISNMNKKIYGHIENWRNRPLGGEHPYVYLDGIWLKKNWGGEVENISVLVAVGVDSEGYRKVLGVAEGCREDKESWLNFLRHLKDRGLAGVRLFISDKCLGLVDALGEVYPGSKWQRCTVHFYRNVLTVTPKGKMRIVADMLKAVHSSEDLDAAKKKAEDVVVKLRDMKLTKAADIVERGAVETFSYYCFPPEHRRSLRTNNPLERINREIRRRTRVVGAFPDGNSALMLAAARLRHIASTKWGTRRYMDMGKLYEQERELKLGDLAECV